MPYLIDGDNLLGTWSRKRSDSERRSLTVEVRDMARRKGKAVFLVFDGSAPPSAFFGSDTRFSGPGRTADDLILEILRKQTDVRGWVVVTNDRSLGDQCRWLEARVERCNEFRRRLVAPDAGEKPEREDDIDYWLRQFGGDT